MDIEFYSIKSSNSPNSLNYVLLKDENEIGSAEGYIDNGVLISVINIFPDYQEKGVGFEVFKKILNELNEVEKIQKIRGVWCVSDEYSDCKNGMSTNLYEFLKNRESNSDIESAFLTPTGKWVKKLGYNNVEIISVSQTETIVDFFKF
jgi:hypothetical protein